MNIIPCTIPPLRQYHEIHWSLRITEAALPNFLAKHGLKADTVYLLPSGGFAVPTPEKGVNK
jgi:hypothetical protein